MTKKQPQFVAVYCQSCGYIDANVSVIAIETIQQLTQSNDAFIICKQCGTKITVDLENDPMKVGKNGTVKLPETTKW